MFHIVYSTFKKLVLPLEETYIKKKDDWQKGRIDCSTEGLDHHPVNILEDGSRKVPETRSCCTILTIQKCLYV